MAKEQLDRAQIGARLQQVNREGVTQRMWRDRFGDVAFAPGCPAYEIDDQGRNGLFGVPAGEQPFFGAEATPILAEDFQQGWRQHHVTILRPLPSST